MNGVNKLMIEINIRKPIRRSQSIGLPIDNVTLVGKV